MVGILMVQAMAIHPGDGIDKDAERIVHEGDCFDEPFLVIEGTMSDSQMEKIGQIHSAKKPTKKEIDPADGQPNPRSQLSWSAIHTSEQVEKNDQITVEVVDFHDDLAWADSSKNEIGLQVTS
jgi:hypothetical protein